LTFWLKNLGSDQTKNWGLRLDNLDPVQTKTWGLIDVWGDVWAKVCHQIWLETISSPQIQVQLMFILHRRVERVYEEI
jgi:hypothetical protein